MEEKTLTDRAKEAVVTCMERNSADAESVAELGKAYAAIITADGMQIASSYGSKLLEEIKNL